MEKRKGNRKSALIFPGRVCNHNGMETISSENS